MKSATSFTLPGALLSLIVLAFVLPACDSALEKDPPFVGSPNFYQNAEDARAAINGVYPQIEGYMYEEGFVGAMEFPTEVVLYEGDPRSSAGALNNFIMGSSNGALTGVYTSAYDAINSANAVIDNVPGIGNMNPDLRARFVAEARFLRALNYFNLAVLFGGVPILESEVVGLTDLERPRAPEDSVYRFIIEDLQAAIPNLPPQSTYSEEQFGRASKGAARTLLAKAYLQRGSLNAQNGITGDRQIAQPEDYQGALDQLNQIISSGEYALESDYRALFASPSSSGQSDEVIFTLNSPLETGAIYGGSGIACEAGPTNADYSPNNEDHFASELPFFTSLPETDARKAATFITTYRKENGQEVTYDADNPDGDGYENLTPAFYKYGVAEIAQGCSDANPFLLFRYADVLLMKAEALNEINQGPTAEAYDVVNQVRRRASVEPLESGLGYEAFREALYVERRRELAFEGHGWPDGQRFFETFKRRVEEVEGERFPPQYWIQNVEVQDPKHRLMPIPQQALDRNSELTQNPGY